MNTIRITLTLVGVFLACWTPYYVICLWLVTTVNLYFASLELLLL